MAHRAILVDVTKCVGCGACWQACQQANGHPEHEPTGFDQNTFTYLMDRGNDVYVRRLCMHCQTPTCVSVCPVAALVKTAEGPVTYDPARCMGCRYCMMACPFGIPKYEWRSPNPRGCKCDMCVHRVAKGRETACASICPTGATVFGSRGALLEEAHRRIKAAPSTYATYPATTKKIITPSMRHRCRTSPDGNSDTRWRTGTSAAIKSAAPSQTITSGEV